RAERVAIPLRRSDRRRPGIGLHVGHRARSPGVAGRAGAAGKRLRRRHRARERHPPAAAVRHPEEGIRRIHRRAGAGARRDSGESRVKKAEVRSQKAEVNKVALAYSGGLDTSVIIPWLKENYGCEVVAIAVDVGQAEETSGLEEKAYKTGACDFYLIDAREEF